MGRGSYLEALAPVDKAGSRITHLGDVSSFTGVHYVGIQKVDQKKRGKRLGGARAGLQLRD